MVEETTLKYCDGFLAKTVTKPLANIYDVLENEICSDQGYLFHFYHEYISERTTETRGFKCRAFINISQ